MLETSSSDRPRAAPRPRLAAWRPGVGLGLVAGAWALALILACLPRAPLALGLALQAPLLAAHTLAHALSASTRRDALARGLVALHGALGRPRRASHLVAVGGALLSVCVGAAAAAHGGLGAGGPAKVVLACLTGVQGVGVLVCSALVLRRVTAHNGAPGLGERGDAAAFLGTGDGLPVCEAQARMIGVLREERARMRRTLGLEASRAGGQGGAGEAQARVLVSAREALSVEAEALAREAEALESGVAGLRAELAGMRV